MTNEEDYGCPALLVFTVWCFCLAAMLVGYFLGRQSMADQQTTVSQKEVTR